MGLYRESGFSIGRETQILRVLSQQEGVQGQRNQELREAQHDQGAAPPDVGHQRAGGRDADRRGQSSHERQDRERLPLFGTNQLATTVKVTG